MAFGGTLMQGKATDRYVLFGMVREIKMLGDWFGCVFIIFLNITQVFSESVAQSSFCFADVKLFAQ